MAAPTPEVLSPDNDAEPRGGAAPVVREPAPAKVNLYLHVTNKFPSGYHGIDSLVVFTRLGDTVEISPAAPGAGIRLIVDGPFADDLGDAVDNLVFRAAATLAERTGIGDGVDIRLTKRLPVASGIGGGSADAAAVIRALARLWDLGGAPDLLFEVALGLGADVPMCLGSVARKVCQVSGIGDEIAPAPPLPACHLVLVNPGGAVATPAVFSARDGAFSKPMPIENPAADAAALAEALKQRGNDLTAPAEGLLPAIGTVLAELGGARECLLARMSGSGATCFGLFATPADAETAAGRLRDTHPDWWVRATAVL
ncbi:MAG: 4-(cytidine 5'-diphospho)-2-C-methyl-D-erythritol kinase [Rhodospirillales bacterium]